MHVMTQRCLLLVFVALLCGQGQAQPPEPFRYHFIHGMTISCFRWGPGEWDQPIMQTTLDDVRALGANWVAIHPYASIQNDGTVRYRANEVTPAVLKPTQWARDRNMQMMVKPHLAYWRSKFPHRLAIDFGDDAAAWARFFDSYEKFIVHQAQLAEQAGARLFVIGTELDQSLQHEARWRRIIAQVDAVFSGELTYAANHDAYDKVPFWDALDCVGVQAYWPISDAANPTDEQLVAGWRAQLRKVTAFAAQKNKMVLLTEVGYAPSAEAASKPWTAHRVERAGAADPDDLKLRAMRIALAEIENHPRIAGAFCWKWFPTQRQISRDFALQYPPMREILRQAWAGNAPSLASRWMNTAGP